MENDKQQITGYRKLSPTEIELINSIKHLGNTLSEQLQICGDMPNTDLHWLNIAKLHLQEGIMAWVRAVAKPEGF